jgi:hypothetical protein
MSVEVITYPMVSAAQGIQYHLAHDQRVLATAKNLWHREIVLQLAQQLYQRVDNNLGNISKKMKPGSYWQF